MDVLSPEQLRETQVDRYPLLMEQAENCHNNEHTVDIARGGDNSPNLSNDENTSGMNPPMHDNRTSSSTGVTTYQIPPASSNRINSRASILSRGEGYGHRRRSPLSSGLWISVELLVTVGQIVASIIVLCLSRDEHPKTPLFEWVMGYAAGCMATLPVLYFRYRNRNRNRGNELESTRSLEGSSQGSPSSEPTSYTVVSVIQTSAEENQRTMQMATRNNENQEALSTRFTGLVNHFKMGLDCFFAVWFVVGNVWIFGGHSSPSDAPKLYRLCIVFLTFSCIGYAMPFILCATICCCLPCIISILGFREDHSQARGASPESINAMPTYKFKSRKNGIVDNHEANSEAGDGGILAAGTEERALSGEDAVCCICLAKYADNEELRELPCSHVFHIECVDKWLKINASCPLCKFEVGDGGGASPAAATTHQNEQRVGYASAEGIYGGTVF